MPTNTTAVPAAEKGYRAAVTVFAPAPQLTVTVEGGPDGDDEIHLHAGGQGLWIARLLSGLGIHTTLCASFGGETGAVLQALIGREPIDDVVAVRVAAVNGAYVHDRRGGERHQVAGQRAAVLARHDRDELYTTAVAAGLRSPVCVLGGYDPSSSPVPADHYRRLAADLRRNGTMVVADLSGDLRDAAMAGGVDMLKTSHEDLAADGVISDLDDETQLVDAMRSLVSRTGIAHLVVTRGTDPTLALSGDQLVSARGPRLEVLDPRGAGDSVTAGITAGLCRGVSFWDALRIGVAAGTINVARHGLATGRAEAIASLVTEVEVRALEERQT
jgi:1-phosphofructokinase